MAANSSIETNVLDVMKDVILPSDERAAQLKTVTGWVSRHGRFYGNDERLARYDGSTHSVCGTCGATCEKHYTACATCREAIDAKRYADRERRDWDGTQYIYSEVLDEWFESPETVEEWLEDNEDKRPLSELRLMLGEPETVPMLDGDYIADQLPDGGDIPPQVEAAMDAFNEAVKGIVLSWSVGRYALKLG